MEEVKNNNEEENIIVIADENNNDKEVVGKVEAQNNIEEDKPQFDEVVIKKVEKKIDPNRSMFDGKILELMDITS